jgi:hypothetical protein|tara:strand:+ start:110 stop:358 length:249 start_codon:yes stop_codon:yes gene_type:complete
MNSNKNLLASDNNIDKILGYKSWGNRRKIDSLLEMDCIMYTELGVDSTKKEREEVKKMSRKIYKAIKSIDPLIGGPMLSSMD